MAKIKILLTGGSGFIGRNIYNSLKSNYQITRPSSKKLDLTDREQVLKFFEPRFFDVVIHCAIKGGRRNEPDSEQVLQKNLTMYFNLMNCKSSFKRFINFASGAEYDKTYNINHSIDDLKDIYPTSPYSMSKNIISRLVNTDENSFNLRIYGVFGPDEEEDRFILYNLKRYKEKKSIKMIQNRYWDFIYIDDLITVLELYINNSTNSLIKDYDLVYEKKNTLLEIAQKINLLDSHRVKINIQKPGKGLDFLGKYNDSLSTSLKGFNKGLKDVYYSI